MINYKSLPGGKDTMLCSPTISRISHVNSKKSKTCDTQLMAMTLLLGLLHYGDKFQNLILTHKPTTTRPRDIKTIIFMTKIERCRFPCT